ncbi:zinc finger SWIM domain-containing protein 7 homolog [Culicoides brevitarsis]|uniref:zinc finger SWIM domain-containing protein 7 homolog n=1 Tax=Culicoides brevitarsis TaxID=469753 RepID=UPI00307B32C5
MTSALNIHEQTKEKAFERILRRIETNSLIDPNYELKSRDVLELYSIFGTLTFRALELLDDSIVRYFTCKNRVPIIITQRMDEKNNVYVFYAGYNYCSCDSFKFNVKTHKIQYTCKHNLVSRISIALKKEVIAELSVYKYKQLLMYIEKLAQN